MSTDNKDSLDAIAAHSEYLDTVYGSSEELASANNSNLSQEVKIVPEEHLGDSTQLKWTRVHCITKLDNYNLGAVLLDVVNIATGELIREVWFPKKLCRNLDLELQTIYVWTPFLIDKKPELLS